MLIDSSDVKAHRYMAGAIGGVAGAGTRKTASYKPFIASELGTSTFSAALKIITQHCQRASVSMVIVGIATTVSNFLKIM